MINTFLIKYGEIGVKGKNRHLFEEALEKQIAGEMKKADGVYRLAVKRNMPGSARLDLHIKLFCSRLSRGLESPRREGCALSECGDE